MEFKFEKGEILKDKVTGFQGVVMGRTEKEQVVYILMLLKCNEHSC